MYSPPPAPFLIRPLSAPQTQLVCATVVELYTEWAGPTAACKSAWRKLALEHGGALPVDLSTACLERCSAPGGPLAEHKATSEPSFLLFKGGTEVACVQGVDIPALMAALATHSAAAGPHGSTAAETEAGSEPAHGA